MWICKAVMCCYCLLLCTGCKPTKPPFDASPWKGIAPDITVENAVDCNVHDKVLTDKLVVHEGDIILFHGLLTFDKADEVPGDAIVVEFVRPNAANHTVFNSGSCVVAATTRTHGEYQVFVKAPKPGKYLVRYVVGKACLAKRDLMVERKVKALPD